MRFERPFCLNLHRALAHQWLEADGLGGYASSSLLCCPTSRFHGLLVANWPGNVHRHVFLSRFEEGLDADGRQFPISLCRYRGTFAPEGHRFVDHVDLAAGPRFSYRIGQVVVEREVRSLRGSRTVLLRWTTRGHGATLTLVLRPFLPCRRADSLTWVNDVLDGSVHPVAGGIVARPYVALPPVAITASPAGVFRPDGNWYRGIELVDDLERGYDGHEDAFTPGEFRIPLRDGHDVIVAASVGEPVDDPRGAWERETGRRAAAVRPPGLEGALDRAAEAFLYRADDGRLGVVAGYPWFGEWGRDTFISLPGLTLARGRVEECGEALSGVLAFLRNGRFPNVFASSPDQSDYHAADPPLWFARAVWEYDRAGGSRERLLDEMLPALRQIAAVHRDARNDKLACGVDGLLRAGTPETAVTWMDAVVAGRPVTAREGAQVEMNALWYALLRHLALLSKEAGDRKGRKEWSTLADLVGRSFVEQFWLPRQGYLADRVVYRRQDRSIRPNMVIAAALELSPLSKEQRGAVVSQARAELLTPRGLRTLSPRDPAYRGRYAGNQHSRDEAYHQGTVWPWLLGPYVEASIRAFGRRRAVLEPLRALVAGFEEHLPEHGVGQVSEVFDGDPPHTPGGAIAQAWSVAELLRAARLLAPRRAAK